LSDEEVNDEEGKTKVVKKIKSGEEEVGKGSQKADGERRLLYGDGGGGAIEL